MLALLFTAVLSATPAAPEAALIGLVEPDGALSTWYVDARGAKRLGKGIAVPRPEGWWLVDISPGKIQEVWARPRTEGTPKWWTQKPAPPKPQPDILLENPDPAAKECDTTHRAQLAFVGPHHLSLNELGFSNCGPSTALGSMVGVYAFAPASAPVGDVRLNPVGVDVLGTEAKEKFLQTAREEAQSNACLGAPVLNEWFISRHAGQWLPSGHLSAANPSCRGTETSFEFVDSLPAEITGPSTEANRVKLLQEHHEFIDAVASPSGKLVIVLEKERFLVRADGKVVARSPVESAPPHAAIVMAQWAQSDKEASRWRTEAARVVGK